MYLVGAGLFFFQGKVVPLDPAGALGSLQQRFAGDRKRLAEYVEATRVALQRLRAKYPALRSYEQARSGSALQARMRSDRKHVYAPGTHTAFGRELYVDQLGFRYADRSTYERVSATHYAKNILVMGGSVAFGFSPESTVSFSDILNESQRDYRFYNASVLGASCSSAAASLREIVATTGIRFERVLAYEGINFLPFGCDPDWLAHATQWQDVERRQELLAQRLREIQTYDAQPFIRCVQGLLEPARELGLGVTFVTVGLAYDEQLRDRELYDEMVNGQCDARFQLTMLRKHNAALLQLGAREPNIQIVDAAAVMFGRPEYFWDSVHLTPVGNKRVAELVHAAFDPRHTSP